MRKPNRARKRSRTRKWPTTSLPLWFNRRQMRLSRLQPSRRRWQTQTSQSLIQRRILTRVRCRGQSRRRPTQSLSARPQPLCQPRDGILRRTQKAWNFADGVKRKTGVGRDTLVVTGEVPARADDKTWLIKERAHGRFERRFEMSVPLDVDKIEATYTDGVLRLVLPKAESTKARKIAVARN